MKHKLFWRIFPLALLIVLAGLALPGRSDAAPDLPKAADLWAQSVALEAKSDYKGALAKMVELNRNGADPYLVNLRSGWLYYLNKDYDLAVSNYQAAAGRAPGASTPLLGLATAFRAKGDADNAIRVARQILRGDAGNIGALHLLGAIYFEKKDYANAATVYETLLKFVPEDTEGLSGYGWAKIYLGHKADAIAPFQRLLVLAPAYQYAQQGYTAATTP